MKKLNLLLLTIPFLMISCSSDIEEGSVYSSSIEESIEQTSSEGMVYPIGQKLPTNVYFGYECGSTEEQGKVKKYHVYKIGDTYVYYNSSNYELYKYNSTTSLYNRWTLKTGTSLSKPTWEPETDEQVISALTKELVDKSVLYSKWYGSFGNTFTQGDNTTLKVYNRNNEQIEYTLKTYTQSSSENADFYKVYESDTTIFPFQARTLGYVSTMAVWDENITSWEDLNISINTDTNV